MAKIPPYCDYANEIRALLDQGRRPEANALGAKYLRAGVTSPLFAEIVAELQQPPLKGQGRPSASPYKWLEIGQEFETMRDGGLTYEAARLAVAEKYCRSESHVEKAVRIYRAAVEASQQE